MRIKLNDLRKIIKEEVKNILKEGNVKVVGASSSGTSQRYMIDVDGTSYRYDASSGTVTMSDGTPAPDDVVDVIMGPEGEEAIGDWKWKTRFVRPSSPRDFDREDAAAGAAASRRHKISHAHDYDVDSPSDFYPSRRPV